MKLCSFPACERRHMAKGLCHTHYEKLRRTGNLLYRARPTHCSQAPCERKVAAKGLCGTHYMKLQRTGTFERLKGTIPTAWTKADIHRYRRYDVTPEEFAEMRQSQENACAICREPFAEDWWRQICQDHDHGNGRSRGLLCWSCNVALGYFERAGIPASRFEDYLDDWRGYHEEEQAKDQPA